MVKEAMGTRRRAREPQEEAGILARRDRSTRRQERAAQPCFLAVRVVTDIVSGVSGRACAEVLKS